MAEVVQHEATGILVGTDHEALARAVTWLLANETLRRTWVPAPMSGPRPGSAGNAWCQTSSSFTSRWRLPADGGRRQNAKPSEEITR